VVVKVHGLATRMTDLDASNKLTSRDLSLESDVIPVGTKAFGAAPETTCWIEKQASSAAASVRLTLKEENLKSAPRSVVFMGARLRIEYPAARGVRPTQCKICWGLHRPGACRAKPRCKICGDPGHGASETPRGPDQMCQLRRWAYSGQLAVPEDSTRGVSKAAPAIETDRDKGPIAKAVL
jgi:hypothetical protein